MQAVSTHWLIDCSKRLVVSSLIHAAVAFSVVSLFTHGMCWLCSLTCSLVSVCECAVAVKLRRLSGLRSSSTGPSASQVVSSIGNGVFHMTGVSGLNSFGEDKTMMLKTYRDPLPIYPCFYELPSRTCCSDDFSIALSRGEEHDERDAIRLYKDTMRECN